MDNLQPQMSPKEIRAIEKILLTRKNNIDVLEWGSGGSTVYFTQFLKRRAIPYTWTSIEYNKLWYNRILEKVNDDPDTSLLLFDTGNAKLKQRDTNMDKYVAYPSMLGKKYDLIIVDGRKRRRCLMESIGLLKPGGVVILHDAWRTYYHCAFAEYEDSRILLWTGLWQGKLEKPRFLYKYINLAVLLLFRVYASLFRPIRKRFLS